MDRGIGFAWLTHSQAILFDGVFSLVGFGVGLMALRVATLVRQPDDEQFQFGYAAFEPTMNAFKGLLTLAVCVFAVASAVTALFAGGRPLQAGYAVVYATVAAVASPRLNPTVTMCSAWLERHESMFGW